MKRLVAVLMICLFVFFAVTECYAYYDPDELRRVAGSSQGAWAPGKAPDKSDDAASDLLEGLLEELDEDYPIAELISRLQEWFESNGLTEEQFADCLDYLAYGF